MLACHCASTPRLVRPPCGLKVGAIGLGVGTVAEYLTGNDRIRFYEIDPQIVELSDKYFSFLKQSRADIEIVPGDARLSLAHELQSSGGNSYDVLIVDAFNSDAVPVHLMTKEAFELYWQHLKPDGTLAVHTAAIHVNFEPLVRDLALVMGKRAVLVRDQGRERGAAHSVWVLLTNNEGFLQDESIRRHPATGKNSKPRHRVWTYDYSNILPYLKWDGT